LEIIQGFYFPKSHGFSLPFTTNLVTAVKNEGLTAIEAKNGVNIDLGTDITCSILAPVNSNYNDLNIGQP